MPNPLIVSRGASRRRWRRFWRGRISSASMTSWKLVRPCGSQTRSDGDPCIRGNEPMFELIRQIRWQDFVDIGIITFLVYRSLQIVRGSRAMQMIIGLAVILVAYVSSRALGLLTLNWILDNFLGSIILVIIVIFQSDIRRALTRVGTAPLFGAERMVQRRDDIIEDVVQAAMALAEKRFGGLIVLQREA